MNTVLGIWETYPAFQALVQSLVAVLWLWAAMDELRKGRKASSIFWLFVSAFMLVMIIVYHAGNRHWGGALVGLLAAAAESWLVFKRLKTVGEE